MEGDLRKIWRVFRTKVKEGFTFAGIKDLVATSGLPVEKLSHLQQRSLPERGSSKSELLDAVDDLISQSKDPNTEIQNLIKSILRTRSDLNDKLAECTRKFGWTVRNGQLQPSEFQVDEAFKDSSEEVRQLLRTAYMRYDQSDFPGAMAAVCSILDTLTVQIFEERNLGDPHKASYQERAVRSFQAFEEAYNTCLTEAQIDDDEVTRIWKNYKGAVNQAAYVLGSFRRNVSDVHGVSQCSPALVRHALDCGTFVIRSITSALNGQSRT